MWWASKRWWLLYVVLKWYFFQVSAQFPFCYKRWFSFPKCFGRLGHSALCHRSNANLGWFEMAPKASDLIWPQDVLSGSIQSETDIERLNCKLIGLGIVVVILKLQPQGLPSSSIIWKDDWNWVHFAKTFFKKVNRDYKGFSNPL